jgi:hypothetical protein
VGSWPWWVYLLVAVARTPRLRPVAALEDESDAAETLAILQEDLADAEERTARLQLQLSDAFAENARLREQAKAQQRGDLQWLLDRLDRLQADNERLRAGHGLRDELLRERETVAALEARLAKAEGRPYGPPYDRRRPAQPKEE